MKALPFLLLLAACDASAHVKFPDSTIALPAEDIALPPGPGAEEVVANCTACHSTSTMLQQPKLTREKWNGVVEKMISVYKAPVDPEAVPKIVDYLVAVQDAK